MLHRDNSTQDFGTRAALDPSRPPTTLAICGDPIICRALVLLLRGPDYDVRYLPAASLGVSGTLAGVQILLLALEGGNEGRRTILDLLENATDADGVHILELSAGLEGKPERRRGRARAECEIFWPCSTEQLKRHIDTAMTSRLQIDGTA